MDDFLNAPENSFDCIDLLSLFLLLVEVLEELSVLERVVLLLHEFYHKTAFLEFGECLLFLGESSKIFDLNCAITGLAVTVRNFKKMWFTYFSILL